VLRTQSHLPTLYSPKKYHLITALITKMTRRKWTTSNQEDWLKSRLAGFSDAQANKTTSKEFFPLVFKEWRNLWPTPDPTPEDVTIAGTAEKAAHKKRTEEDAVRLLI
jgi:hypothetical protein